MINLPLNKLKQIEKSRNIKDYINKSKEYWTKILSESEPKITLFFFKKIEDIKKCFSELTHGLRYGFSKSKINQFIRSLYNIKIQKNLPAPKIKETKKNLGEVDEDYYKTIKIKSSFNGIILNIKVKGSRIKIYCLENILIPSDHI